jgi:hypothetical protein
MKSNLVKIITISSFIVLICLFVLYRNGNFDPPANLETAELNSMALDTPEVKTVDSVAVMPEIMPSSKSGVIFKDRIQKPANDSAKKPK